MPPLDLPLFTKPVAPQIDGSKLLTQGLSQLWLLHEGAPNAINGPATREVVAGRIGTFTGNNPATNYPVWAQGDAGSAVDFANNGGFIDVPDPGLGAANFSAIVRAYLPNTSQKGAIVKLGSPTTGYGLGVGATSFEATGANIMGLYEGLRWLTTSVAYAAGWHTFALVGDASGYPTVFYDGRQIYADTTAGPTAPATAWHLGGYLGGSGEDRFFDGLVSWAAFYTRALTAGEVLALHARPFDGLLWQPRVLLPVSTGAAAAQFARPAADVADGTWTNEAASNVNLYASIDEAVASDAAYIQSALHPATTDITKIRLGSVTDPAVGTGHVLRIRYLKDTTGGEQINLTWRLYAADGTTQIATGTVNNIDAVTTVAYTLSGTEADSIPAADYSAGLVVALEATAV